MKYSSSPPLSDQQRGVESKGRVKDWLREPGKEAPWNTLNRPKNGIAESTNAVDAQRLGHVGERRPRL